MDGVKHTEFLTASRPMSRWQACCHDSDAMASLSR